jgi:hypothetical protein
VKGCRHDCRLALRFDPDLFLALVGLAAGGFYMTMIVHPPYRAIARLVDHVLTKIDDLGAELACRRSDARGHAPDGDVN